MGRPSEMLNKVVGSWTIIAPAGHDKHKLKLWLCRCVCGYERVFGTSYLNTNGPSKCPRCRESLRGTSEQELVSSYLGMVVGDYTVVQLAGRNQYGSRLWLCRCKCGSEREFLTAALSGNGRRKATRCMKCVLAQMETDNRVTNDIPHRFWKRLEDRCGRPGFRAKAITLTREDALQLFLDQGGRCALTGVPLWFTKLRTNFNLYTTASLDRIDSGKPYEAGNVQWVHKVVNMMKGSLTQMEFMDWCRKVSSGPLGGGVTPP